MPSPNLFTDWCANRPFAVGAHRLNLLAERDGTRSQILPRLSATVASHYEASERFAARMARVGFEKAAGVLRGLLPQSAAARSGDMGEILATEVVPELMPTFRIPIKRLRWKDAREQAMRGEDLIGVASDAQGVRFLKGEAKSGSSIGPAVIAEARSALDRNEGRPSQHAMIFVMQRLRDLGEDGLADVFEAYLMDQAIAPERLTHLCFCLCGNDADTALTNDLAACTGAVHRHSITLRIPDHQAFVRTVYEAVHAHAGIR